MFGCVAGLLKRDKGEQSQSEQLLRRRGLSHKAAFRARGNGLMDSVNGRQVLKIQSPEITSTTKTRAAKAFTRIR